MNVLDATRKWLRDECPLIDKHDRFNANYLGATPVEYTLRMQSESHAVDVVGKDMPTYRLVFVAQLPFGERLADNLSAAEFFSQLSTWIRAQNRTHIFPEVSGYTVTEVEASNAGVVTQAEANAARYQLQLRIKMEEE